MTKKHEQATPELIAIARVIGGMAIDVTMFDDPLKSVLHATQNAAGDKLKAFKQAAKQHGLRDTDQLLRQAARVDPNTSPVNDGLSVLSADTILTTKYPEPVWAIPDLLPVGLGILAGAPKQGKTWLAFQVALAVASGGVVLGKNVQRGAVLYLALEDSPRRIQERMQKQGWARGLPVEFIPLGEFTNQVGDLQNGGGERLARQIEKRGYRLVVIDTLSRAVRGDQNDVDQMTRALTPLQEIAHAKNVALLMVDHHRKTIGDAFDAVSDILGSTAKGAMADTLWGLYRERGKKGAKLAITGRDVEERTLALTMDWGVTYCWQCEGDANALELTERRQEILDALTEIGKPAQVATVAEMIGQDRGNTFRRLQDLTSIGKVKRINQNGKILYALSDSGLL